MMTFRWRRKTTKARGFVSRHLLSSHESLDDNDQDKVLKLLNLFMAEMLHVVRALRGDFEKNTGDGMMAYFKDGAESECAQRAVDAAVTMHCYNDQVISPRLKTNGLPEVRFRVGIETGLVTIANVGVRGDHHSLVAIGNVPNVACKLLNEPDSEWWNRPRTLYAQPYVRRLAKRNLLDRSTARICD